MDKYPRFGICIAVVYVMVFASLTNVGSVQTSALEDHTPPTTKGSTITNATCSSDMNNSPSPRYLTNITEKDIFRHGIDSAVFDYPNEMRVINGIGYIVCCYSNSLVLTNLTNTSNIIQTTYKQDDTFLYMAHSIVVTPDQKYAYTVTYGPSSYLCMWNVTDIYTTPSRLNQSYLPLEVGMYLELLDNYLILTTKSKIHIYDITHRNTTRQMTELSSFSYSTVNSSTIYWHTMVVDNYLFVTSAYSSTSGGFVVFDITNKANPTEVRRVNETINFVEFRQYYWHGFHYLIIEGQEKPSIYYKGYIYVYNFSSGSIDNPTFLYRKSTVRNNSWFAGSLFIIKNGYIFSMQKCYNTSTYSGIQVWNLTDLNNPSFVSMIYGNGAPNYLNLCHEEEFDQNGSDRTLSVLTQNDDSLVTIHLSWSNDENSNSPPSTPQRPTGRVSGKIKIAYTYNTSTTDPNDNQVYYKWSWGDENISTWIGPYDSGSEVIAEHTWTTKGVYNIKVKAKDTHNAESDWSDPLTVTMPCSNNLPFTQFLMKIFERFPNAIFILRHMIIH